MKPWLRTAITLVIAFTAASTAAQQATKAAPAAAPVQKGSDGVPDSIKLHGNWVLDVRNPDGALVGHSEFQNALTSDGRATLARMLSLQQPFFDLFVAFNEAPPPNEPLSAICNSGGGALKLCFVTRPGGPWPTSPSNAQYASISFQTLSMAAVAGKVVLTGNFTVTAAGGGRVQSVTTHFPRNAGDSAQFTVAILPTSLAVVQGQIVQFTYTLSFS